METTKRIIGALACTFGWFLTYWTIIDTNTDTIANELKVCITEFIFFLSINYFFVAGHGVIHSPRLFIFVTPFLSVKIINFQLLQIIR